MSSRLGFKEIREEPAPTPTPAPASTPVPSGMEPSAVEESKPTEETNPTEEPNAIVESNSVEELNPVEKSNSNVVSSEIPIEQIDNESNLIPEDSENSPEYNLSDHPAISKVSDEIAVMADEIADMTNELGEDCDVDVEAELGLPPLVPPPMMVTPEQVATNPVVSFAEMNDAGKKKMLDDLINESLAILDSIPVREWIGNNV